MFSRIATRVPLTAAYASKRIASASIRATSSSSSSSATRVMEIAAQVERPTGAEAAVPVMWAACGVLTYAVWNRMGERSAGEHVEQLLVV